VSALVERLVLRLVLGALKKKTGPA